MRDVSIAAHEVTLGGTLDVPDNARGIVIFAHGSGGSRHSPRNLEVASALAAGGMATLLFDLLTRDERREDVSTGRFRFDIDRLATRLEIATEWVMEDATMRALPVAYFGTSTGAAAALVAAARLDDYIAAVVSRGGRLDLAGTYLPRVTAPTLLIVGERDTPVLELNREASVHMRCTRELIVVPRATHHFDEPGAMAQVSALANGWLQQHIPAAVPHWVEHGAGRSPYQRAAR